MGEFGLKLHILLFAFLSIIKLSLSQDYKEFHWGQLLDFTNDEDAKNTLAKAIEDKERIGLGCITTLINKNFYTSASFLFQNYYKKRNLSQKAIWEYRDAMKKTKYEMENLLKLSKRAQSSYLERSPPTQWAQSLDEVQMQIKFSLRHGVPGWINIFDLNVTFSRDTVNLTAFCFEGEIKMKYVLNLHLWGTIKPEESYYEEQSVGELILYLEKDVSPIINAVIRLN